MKNSIKLISLLMILSLGTFTVPQKAVAQVTVNFQTFYDNLSPYGNWVDNRDYGYVWMPNVSAGFTPYNSNGYWVFTDQGWTWVSNYSWGWAPFHYGRWFYEPYHGWLWVPDNEWGPGWVTWRSSNDYYGWAPIGPGVSIDLAYSNGYNLPYNQWTFVRDRDFGRTNINNYYINNSNNVTIINNTTVINNRRFDRTRNVTFNSGPERSEVEKRAGKTFTTVAITESDKPGQHLSNNQLKIYKPRVEDNNSIGHKAAPAKIVDLKDTKPNRQKADENRSQQEGQTNRQQKQQQNQKQRNEQQQNQKQQQQQKNEQQQKQQQKQQQERNEQQQNQKQQQQQQRNDQKVQHQQSQQTNPNQPVKQQTNQHNPNQNKKGEKHPR